MKTPRVMWLDLIINDVHDPNDPDFLILEERLRSGYQKLDSDFRQKAKGEKSLCSNLAYIYELVWTVFFFVQRTTNFLFYAIRSNSFTWPLPRFMEKVRFTYCIHLLPKTTRKEGKYHGPQPFIFYHYLK